MAIKVKRKPRYEKTYKRQVKIVLQGRDESFEDYEVRLNQILKELKSDMGDVIVLPSASSSGRICSVINFKLFI